MSAEVEVAAVRRFGRFYTRRIGVLEEGLLDSPFPLAEARLIYEIAHHEPTSAKELGEATGLDAGYLSRLLGRLERPGLLSRRPSPEDRRVKRLGLTRKGRQAFRRLDEASRKQVEAMLADLSPEDRRKIVGAMGAIEQLLGGSREEEAPFWLLRPPQPGDMGWVVQRHGFLYGREYGWDEQFEALVAEIVAKFLRRYDPARERCWIAERGGENVGCVFLVRKSPRIAQLRLLLVEPDARGLGIGRRLVGECSRFARQAGYRRITLWTNDVLHAARHIYEREGYKLVREEKHHSFGHDLVGQYWELSL